MLNFCIYIFIIYAVSNSAAIILFGRKRRRLRQRQIAGVPAAKSRRAAHAAKTVRQKSSVQLRATAAKSNDFKKKNAGRPLRFCFALRELNCCKKKIIVL